MTSRVANCDVKQYVRYRTGHNRALGASVRKSFVNHETAGNLKSSFHSSWRQCPSTGRCCFGYLVLWKSANTRELKWVNDKATAKKSQTASCKFQKSCQTATCLGPFRPVLARLICNFLAHSCLSFFRILVSLFSRFNARDAEWEFTTQAHCSGLLMKFS